MPQISRQESVGVVKKCPQERISERMGEQSRIIEVPKNLMPEKCRGSPKYPPQDRISERMCEQSEVVKVTETSSQDQMWHRTVGQSLDDTWHEPASRFSESTREKTGKGETEKILRFLTQFEEGSTNIVFWYLPSC